MSNSIFRDDGREDHDNDDDDGGGDRNSDQEQLELRKDEEEFVDEGDKKDEGLVNVTVAGDDDFLEKEEQQTEDDENDGFRTPTSVEHRIPVPTECPPAPRKSCKRKFEGSITEIIKSATKAIHERFMVFKKAREDDDALS